MFERSDPKGRMRESLRRSLSLALLAALGVSLTAWGASSSSPEARSGRPVWLGEVGFELSVSHDDNVYFQDLDDLSDRSSLVVSVKPRFVFRILRPKEQGSGARLGLVYAPEFVRYPSWSEQGHETHRVLLSYDRSTPTTRWRLVNELLVTEGRRVAQDWPSPLGLPRSPVIGGPEFRSRTANNEIRGRTSVRKTVGERWFVRPRAEWWASDFRTEQRETPIPNPADTFYGNYVDRASFTAGFDVGRRIGPRTYLTTGYLLGIQDQGQLVGSPYQYDNHFQVLLIGIEGAPSDRLSYSLQVGPDFRSYGSAIRPGDDPHPTEIYLDGRLLWKATVKTSAEGRMRQFKFMPGGGQGAMAMTLVDLELRREIVDELSLAGGVEVFRGSLAEPDPRGTDWLFTAWMRLTWRESDSRELSLGVLLDDGQSEAEDFYETPIGVIPGPNGSGREYTRRIVTASVKITL
jgi:hypothetical protein